MRFWKPWLFIITLCFVFTTTINPGASESPNPTVSPSIAVSSSPAVSPNPTASPSSAVSLNPTANLSTVVSSWEPIQSQACLLDPTQNNKSVSAIIDAISSDGTSSFVRFWCPQKRAFDNILVGKSTSQKLLNGFKVGDQVNLFYSKKNAEQIKKNNDSIESNKKKLIEKNDPTLKQQNQDLKDKNNELEKSNNVLIDISISYYELPWWERGLLFFGSFILCLVFIRFITKGVRHLMIGDDGRFSNSKTQIVIWFFILISAYIATTIARFITGLRLDLVGGIGIPQNLLILSGISTTTFAAAKQIIKNSNRVPASTPPVKSGWSNFFPDLFNKTNTEELDLGDFQMTIIALLTVAIYVCQMIGYLSIISLQKNITLPDVDSTLLATFGLGQTAYLAKKFIDSNK